MTNSKNIKTGWMCSAKLEMEESNPIWKVEKSKAKKLLELWDSLKTIVEAPKSKSAYLGYKGTFLKADKNVEWHTFGNVVTLTNNNQIETRFDKSRKFEKELLKSAPSGKIPDALFALEFGF
ncbi:MAG: hypothetical protein NTU73_15545 [Ignavibacteriae bacterium]|nr:hypothetical protein [Ignavibacteriota bacterium]